MRRHSPYNFAFNNPVFFIDYDGMEPSGSIDPDDPIVYTGEGVAIGENIVNQLDEVCIGCGTTASGVADHAYMKSTEGGERFHGLIAEGTVQGEYGKINGHISAFNGGYNSTDGHIDASIHGITANGSMRFGTKDNNITIEGDGSFLKAEVVGDAKIHTNENGKLTGGELGGELGAYGAVGEVTPSVTIFGYNIGFTVGGSAGSAHVGGRAALVTGDDFEITLMGHAGFGAGLKGGFTITKTNQEISKKKKK